MKYSTVPRYGTVFCAFYKSHECLSLRFVLDTRGYAQLRLSLSANVSWVPCLYPFHVPRRATHICQLFYGESSKFSEDLKKMLQECVSLHTKFREWYMKHNNNWITPWRRITGLDLRATLSGDRTTAVGWISSLDMPILNYQAKSAL